MSQVFSHSVFLQSASVFEAAFIESKMFLCLDLEDDALEISWKHVYLWGSSKICTQVVVAWQLSSSTRRDGLVYYRENDHFLTFIQLVLEMDSLLIYIRVLSQVSFKLF